MFSSPEKSIDKCGIQVGMDIADFGAGSGLYTFASARSLMSTGRVYAVDVQKELLSKLKNDATRRGLYNVEVIWGDLDKPSGSKLREHSVDLVLLCNILFQSENQKAVMMEAKRVLKPAGRVLVVDWESKAKGVGPKETTSKKTVLGMFEKAGFHLDREVEAGEHHYGLLFKKL